MRYDVATKVVVEHGKEAILKRLVGIEAVVRRLLERRRDIMIESPAYEIIKEEGLREGIQQGMLEEAREMVLEALSVKFGVLPIDLIEEIKGIQLREVLKQLLRAAMTVESLDQFREQLGRVKG